MGVAFLQKLDKGLLSLLGHGSPFRQAVELAKGHQPDALTNPSASRKITRGRRKVIFEPKGDEKNP